MDQRAEARRMLVRRAANQFIGSVTGLTAALPHPDGASIRATLTDITTGQTLGHVDTDVTNLGDLARHADRRTHVTDVVSNTVSAPAVVPAPAVSARPNLRVVGGGQ
jgi:hypothetical protein